MKIHNVAVGLCTLVGGVAAFPADFKATMAERAASGQGCPFAKRGVEGIAPEKRAVGFDPKLQYVSNTGAHAFIAPGPTDNRGPCPGLNAMANHGYIPHNGVATIQQFVTGTYQVFGMGTDLATFLAVYGAVMDGDLTSWSIGGPTAALPAGLNGILAQPQGISGSHNKYESDVSPTRGDLYEYGNDYLLRLDQFTQMYNLPLGPAGYDLTTLTPFRATRFQQSIANNPYFFNGPFSGVAVQPAAYTFTYRFMANKSAEYPEGYLDADVLKSFHAITGAPGSFQYTPGYERIPDNWYKRAVGDEYTIPYFQTDLNAAALQHPEFLEVGGNTGTTNSFTPIDISDLTGGVYNAKNLAQGNNALCFAYQFAAQAAPDVLKGLYANAAAAIAALTAASATAVAALGCPQLKTIDDAQFAQFPGYTGKYDGYAPVGDGL